MPLDDAQLLAVKNGVVELTVPIRSPEMDGPEAFGASVHALLLDHQFQVMTDPTILDSDELNAATCLESRDPLPAPLTEVLLSLGFEAISSEGGGRPEASLFSKFKRRQRTKLDRWRLLYRRASALSQGLGVFESALVEQALEGDFAEVGSAAAELVRTAAREAFGIRIEPGMDGSIALERRILEARRSERGRWVLRAEAVRAVAAFMGESILVDAPGTRWVNTAEGEALWVVDGAGHTVRTDPEFRVVQFVTRGRKALLSAYLESVTTPKT